MSKPLPEWFKIGQYVTNKYNSLWVIDTMPDEDNKYIGTVLQAWDGTLLNKITESYVDMDAVHDWKPVYNNEHPYFINKGFNNNLDSILK